jgi:BirA family biotin operon repressor/biotin-[acetyl-CoA-carboxylase] ligase
MALVAGVAVRAAAAAYTPAPLRVKWPNDVVVGRKKLAGILVESRLDGARVDALVVGIGVNVHARSLPEEIAETATSLALLAEEPPGRGELLVKILVELQIRIGSLTHDARERVFAELRREDALLGERVTVGAVSGVGAGIDDDGQLLIRDDDGTVHAVSSGTVERA